MLGIVFFDQGKRAEAATEYRNAIELDPKHPLAYVVLGQILFQQGQFSEARQANQRCLDLLPANDPRRNFVSQQLNLCEQMLVLDKKLAAILKGKAQPADAAEQVSLGHLCYINNQYADAARFFADAFAAQPALADDLPTSHRYDAACSAALAAAGQGKAADKMDDKERARLRKQSLDWLRADLALWSKQPENGTPDMRATVQKKLRHWQEDTDLASVRDAAALDKLPEAERAEWKKLWADVADLLKKSGDGK
jgi:tetratricopeptide (TPR) repeat protein